MEAAFRLFSRYGYMNEEVKAVNIPSYADARHKAPFVDVGGFPVYWKGWSEKRTVKGKKRVAHFCRYPHNIVKGKMSYPALEREIEDLGKTSEGDVHKKAREMLTEYLQVQLAQGSEVSWSYKDNEELSDFPLKGNLLESVIDIRTHYRYHVKELERSYEYDIALLGEQVNKEPIIMGVIEIEKSHRFGPIKLLVSKSIAFPVLSINVEELTVDDITPEWCERVISETKANSEDHRRRNYVYLHNMLVPFYLNLPKSLQSDRKHSFIVFCKSDRIEALLSNLKTYRRLLGLLDQSIVHIHHVKLAPNNESSEHMFENEGSIAGAQWREYCEDQYIRIQLSTENKSKGKVLLFSLIMARLLNNYYDVIVGYKYAKAIDNSDKKASHWMSGDGTIRIAPKTLSEPIVPILAHYEKLGMLERIKKQMKAP